MSSSNRASQAPWGNPTTAVPGPEGPALIIKTRVLDGILTGLAAAAVAGALWWAVATAAKVEQWHLGAALVGLIVGQGVLIGSRRGGIVSGLLALVLATVTVVVTVYFIDRSQMIIAFNEVGRTSDVPLWQGFTTAKEMYRGWWDYEQNSALLWLLGPILAVLIAGWPGRRPVVT